MKEELRDGSNKLSSKDGLQQMLEDIKDKITCVYDNI